MDKPQRLSNAEAANRSDAHTYWRIGRAYCRNCHTVKAYVARIDVDDLRCDCGELCRPAHEDDSAERERR